MIPSVLREVESYLRNNEVKLPSGGEDLRADSSQAEQKVVQFLQNAGRWKVRSPAVDSGNNRAWYDAEIAGYFVDIKISQCKASDNTNAKKAIYYFLTGVEADSAPQHTDQFFKSMKEKEEPDEKRDYYYLIVNKNEPADVFFVSLKGLAHCMPAPNNLPFQSNWGKCREQKERTWAEAKDFLLSAWAASIKELIKKQQNGMPKTYPEIFSD